MARAVYLHIAVALSVVLVDAQPCDEYTVKVEQLDYLENEDARLNCSFTSTEQDGIIWQTKAVDADPYRTAYTAYPNSPEYDGPEPGFALDGQQDISSHTLTIIDAKTSDNYSFWRCIVNTPDCSNQNEGTQPLTLTFPYFNESNVSEVERDGKVDVTCYALSDPQSTVTLEGSSTGQTCVRVDGDPPRAWNCSVTTTVKKKHVYVDVEFEVRFGQTVRSPAAFRILLGMWWVWILLITLAVVGTCAGIAVGIVVYLKKNRPSVY